MRQEEIRWHETADIIVIGSGFAGLAAAIETRDHGTSVIVIEKMKAPGGNSIIRDGGIAATGTEEQHKELTIIKMKNGKPATQGFCPICGTKMFRIGKK